MDLGPTFPSTAVPLGTNGLLRKLVLLAWSACKFYSSYSLLGFEAFVAHKYVLSQPSLPFLAYHLMHGKFGILPEYDHTNL